MATGLLVKLSDVGRRIRSEPHRQMAQKKLAQQAIDQLEVANPRTS
jgi:hypothetical protein